VRLPVFMSHVPNHLTDSEQIWYSLAELKFISRISFSSLLPAPQAQMECHRIFQRTGRKERNKQMMRISVSRIFR
jgi:hypothetical protein